MDFSAIFKAKQAWNQFNSNHPKFAPFIDAVKRRGVTEGTVIELEVRYPDDGGSMKTNIKVTESDLEALSLVSSLFSGK